MRVLTPTLSICALAAAFTAGALTAAPDRGESAGSSHAVEQGDADLDVAATDESGEIVTISIEDFGFDTPPVAAGSTVRVVNLDAAPHTVTAVDGAFDVFVDPGESATFVVPTTPGTYAFFCAVHPAMTSELVVG